MNQKLYAIDKSGNQFVGPVLIPFFTTVFPAFLRKADWIEIHSSLATGEVHASYAKGKRTAQLLPSVEFKPFVASIRIRILAGLSISPDAEKQTGQIRVCFMNNLLDVDVEIEVKNDVENLRLKPLWENDGDEVRP